MPPRSAKKATAAPGAKRSAGKTSKAAQEQAETVPEPVRVQKEAVEEVTVVSVQNTAESNSALGAKEELKANYDDYDKGERLELEDNEPESEPEEDVGIDYGDKELDQHDVQEEIEEIDEEDEEGEGDKEDGDMVDEELEDDGEEVEDEGDEENDEEDQDVDAEEEDHHEVVKERRKRKEFEVFVGGLDKDVTEADLKKVFSQVGEVTEVRLMMNPITKKNKGFAFLRFATAEQAKQAVEELKNPVVNGKQCGVSPSQDNDTLFVGNICKTWTREAFKEKLKSYGIENIEDLTLVEDSNNEGMNRGFAFLEFSSRSDAMDAYKRLQKRDVVFGTDRTAKVAFAGSFIEPDDEIMAQVKTVFVDGLPASWDEERVKRHLKKFGEIEKIELARNMPSAKRKDFGFVTFDTHDAAVACAEGINNAELGEGDNKVKVRARLSRPHQKGRGVMRSFRGDYGFTRGGGIRGWRAPWSHGALRFDSRRFPAHVPRGVTGRGPLSSRGFRRPFPTQNRRPVAPPPPPPLRGRHVPPPERSYDRRPPMPAYTKNSSKREYAKDDELPLRSRPSDFGPRVPLERRPSYRDDYTAHGSSYSDRAIGTAPRSAPRRAYEDDGYGHRFEQPPIYHDGRGRDYDSISGSKRPYASMNDVPSRYSDSRHSRARLDYGVGGVSSYDDGYGESARFGRSSYMYNESSRSSLSGQHSHGLYDSRGLSYGSVGGSDVGGMYSSSSYKSEYLSRDAEDGGSYSSLYSSRGLGGSGYISGGGRGSGSYY